MKTQGDSAAARCHRIREKAREAGAQWVGGRVSEAANGECHRSCSCPALWSKTEQVSLTVQCAVELPTCTDTGVCQMDAGEQARQGKRQRDEDNNEDDDLKAELSGKEAAYSDQQTRVEEPRAKAASKEPATSSSPSQQGTAPKVHEAPDRVPEDWYLCLVQVIQHLFVHAEDAVWLGLHYSYAQLLLACSCAEWDAQLAIGKMREMMDKGTPATKEQM